MSATQAKCRAYKENWPMTEEKAAEYLWIDKAFLKAARVRGDDWVPKYVVTPAGWIRYMTRDVHDLFDARVGELLELERQWEESKSRR